MRCLLCWMTGISHCCEPAALVLLLVGALVSIVGFVSAGADSEGETPSPSVTSGYLDVDGGRLYYEEVGSGECIVLVHDGLLHHATWDGQFDEFARTHRVVRYDRRGYGKSDFPTSSYSNVADLLKVFDQLGIEQAWLIGMSAGGGLSIDFTLAHPERVIGLVLAGAVVRGFDYTPHFYTRGGRLTREVLNDPVALRAFFSETDPYTVVPAHTVARERVKSILAAYPQNADLSKHNLEAPLPSAVERLGEIQKPTLIMVGEHDIPDVHAHAGAIDAGIPGARRVVISDAGHLVPLEQPEAFNAEVRAFLREGPLFHALACEGVGAAVARFEDRQRVHPGEPCFDEPRMNGEGYRLLLSGRADEAIELFKLVVRAYPDSWNAYDSLAEGYMTRGDRALAIANYEKSLELNPDNEGARRRLEELRRDQ